MHIHSLNKKTDFLDFWSSFYVLEKPLSSCIASKDVFPLCRLPLPSTDLFSKPKL